MVWFTFKNIFRVDATKESFEFHLVAWELRQYAPSNTAKVILKVLTHIRISNNVYRDDAYSSQTLDFFGDGTESPL